jgi:hypothetical protein
MSIDVELAFIAWIVDFLGDVAKASEIPRSGY